MNSGDTAWVLISAALIFISIGCGICAGVCPCSVWNFQDNPEEIKMYRIYNAG